MGEFDRPDDPLYIVGMDLCRGIRICLHEQRVERFRSLFPCKISELLSKRRVLIHLCKIDIIEKRLDIKAGASAYDWDPAL